MKKLPFTRTPVVLISRSGRAIHLQSIRNASEFLGIGVKGRVQAAIEKGYPVKGYRIVREDDWSPVADYSFRPSEMHDENGLLTEAGRKHARKMQERSLTEEQKKNRSERCREMCLKMIKDPNSNFAKGLNKKPVHCLNNNTDYGSIVEAARALGFKPALISYAMSHGGKTHGYKFYSKEVWDAVQKKSLP